MIDKAFRRAFSDTCVSKNAAGVGKSLMAPSHDSGAGKPHFRQASMAAVVPGEFPLPMHAPRETMQIGTSSGKMPEGRHGKMADVAGDDGGRLTPQGEAPEVRLRALQSKADADGLDRVTDSLRKLDAIVVSTSIAVASALVFGAGNAIPFREAFSAGSYLDSELFFKAVRNTIFFYLLVGAGLIYFFRTKRRLIRRGDAYLECLKNADAEARIEAGPALREFEDTREAQKCRAIVIAVFVLIATAGIVDIDAQLFLP